MFNCWVYICVFLCWSAGTDWSWSQGFFGYHQLNQNFTQRTCLHNFFLKGAFSYTATYRWDWCLPCIPPKKSLSPSVFTNGITLHPPDQARCLGFITDISSPSHTNINCPVTWLHPVQCCKNPDLYLNLLSQRFALVDDHSEWVWPWISSSFGHHQPQCTPRSISKTESWKCLVAMDLFLQSGTSQKVMM